MSAAAAAPKSKQQLLAPRLYKTDIDILNSLSIDRCRDEFEALRRDFEADYNRALFKWGPQVQRVEYQPLIDEFYEFLHRSSIGEFSGCLLYSDVQKHVKDPTLRAIYRCMGRDEGRHSSFLNWVMRHMGRPFDLANLPKVDGMQYMHPKWIFVTTYLSEIVGFYRYQNISDHLKLHPEFNFHPLFDYFDDWCKDERRHSRFFALMMRSQPEYYSGFLSLFGVKFFTLAVYITMYLRDAQSTVYREARHRVGAVRLQGDRRDRGRRPRHLAARDPHALELLPRLPAHDGGEQPPQQARPLGDGRREDPRRRRCATSRFASNILQYAKLMAQPHDWAPEVPRSEWTKVCEDPGPAHGLALEGAVAVTLRDRKELVPA